MSFDRTIGTVTMADNAERFEQIRERLNGRFALNEDERAKLSKTDLKRYDKLTAILAKLNAGEKVYTSDLQRWLKDDYASIAELWELEKETREQFSSVPEELREYENKIKKGLFFEGRRDSYRRHGNFKAASNMDARAESEFEDALIRLEELITEDDSYRTYFDRAISFEFGSALGASAIELPRLITSRSLDRQGKGIKAHIRRKQDVKIDVVEQVLTEIAESARNVDVKKPCENSTKLQQLLNINNDDDFFNGLIGQDND